MAVKATQKEVAKRLNCSRGHVCEVLRGKCDSELAQKIRNLYAQLRYQESIRLLSIVNKKAA